MFEGETPCQIITQRLHAVALGGVMTGRDEAHAILTRAVEGLLGSFAGQVQVDPGGNRLVDLALAAARAPANAADQPVARNQQRLAPEHLLDVPGKIGGAHRLGQ